MFQKKALNWSCKASWFVVAVGDVVALSLKCWTTDQEVESLNPISAKLPLGPSAAVVAL